MKEPNSPIIDHSCGHGISGPFQALVAGTDPGTGGVFQKTHFSYNIETAAALGGRAHLTYRTLNAGPATFYVYPEVAVRLRASDGKRVHPVRAQRTTTCAKISWYHQFDLPGAGDYDLELGPGVPDVVYLILERDWPYPEAAGPSTASE